MAKVKVTGLITVYGKKTSKRKTKSGQHQLNLYEELKSVLSEIETETRQSAEKGLEKAADYFVQKLKVATPQTTEYATGETARSWVVEKKYYGVKYINNTRLNSQRIPVVNLLEFGKKGNPFVRKTFEAEKSNIINIIIGELKK